MNAPPLATFASSNDVTQLSCFRITGTNLDAFDNRFTLVGRAADSNGLSIDVTIPDGSVHHFTAAYGSMTSGYMNFADTTSTAKMTLKVATTSKNGHRLYAGTSVVTTAKATYTNNLSCDVNKQFRVSTADRIKGYQAQN